MSVLSLVLMSAVAKSAFADLTADAPESVPFPVTFTASDHTMSPAAPVPISGTQAAFTYLPFNALEAVREVPSTPLIME